jgi:hypothetical protein
MVWRPLYIETNSAWGDERRLDSYPGFHKPGPDIASPDDDVFAGWPVQLVGNLPVRIGRLPAVIEANLPAANRPFEAIPLISSVYRR